MFLLITVNERVEVRQLKSTNKPECLDSRVTEPKALLTVASSKYGFASPCCGGMLEGEGDSVLS